MIDHHTWLRPLAAGMLALALVGAGWWLGRQRPATVAAVAQDAQAASTDPAPAPEPAGGDQQVTHDPEASTDSAGAAVAPALLATPLPPLDAPLTEVFDDLLQRARRGDHRAACRLAVDLQLCQIAQYQPQMQRSLERMAVGENDDRQRESMVSRLAELEQRGERMQRICSGIGQEQLQHGFDLQVQAAQARPELRVWAATQPLLDRQLFASELEQWQRYRQLSLQWLEAAAAEGDLSAIVLLARVHGDDRRPSPPVPPYRIIDDARFLLYAELMDRYGLHLPALESPVEAARQRLGSMASEGARQQAERLFRPDRLQSLDAEAMQQVLRRSFDAQIDAANCE